MGYGGRGFGGSQYGYPLPNNGMTGRQVPPLDGALLAIDATGGTDVPLDADGFYLLVHRADHAMEMALLLEFGSVPVAKDAGSSLSEIRPDDEILMTADATRRVAKATAHLTSAGDVTILKVRCYARGAGRVHIEVNYLNLRLGGQVDSTSPGPTRFLEI